MKKIFWIIYLSVGCFWVRAELIVAPNDRAAQSGNTFTLSGFDGPSTFQNVYGARNFSGPVVIHGIAFRQNEGSGGGSFDAVIPRMVIRISTYSGTFESFNQFSYDSNKGSDDLVAFDAAIHWTTTDLPGSVPNPFDLKIQFSKPFVYDPSNGALLINYQSVGPFSGAVIADSHAHGDPTIGWAGGNSAGNIVTQFDVTSIPEPEIPKLVFATLLIAFLLRRR